MTAARAVALILALVRRERAKTNAAGPQGAEGFGRVCILDALEEYIRGLMPKGKGGK